MADGVGRVEVEVAEVLKTEVTVLSGGSVSDLSELIPSYEPGAYRFDPPKDLVAGKKYMLTLLDDGTALLRLPWTSPKVTEHDDRAIASGATLGPEGTGSMTANRS